MEKILKDNLDQIVKDVQKELNWCILRNTCDPTCKYYSESAPKHCLYKHAHDSVSDNDIRLIIEYTLNCIDKYR